MAEKRSESKRAVALRYDPTQGDNAPKVVAKGRGRTAQRIIDLAQKNAVPVRPDPNLVRVLSRLELDQEIPAEVYQAVAAVLAFIHRMNRQAGG